MADTATKATGAAQSTDSEAKAEDKPKRNTYRAEQFFDLTLALVKKSGESGISVKDLAVAVKAEVKRVHGADIDDNHAYRIAHNVGWTLEGQPVYRAGDEEHTAVTRPDRRQIHRLPGSNIRYVMGAGKEGTKAQFRSGEADFWLTKKALQARKTAQAA